MYTWFDISSFNYKVIGTSIAVVFKFSKMSLRRQPFSRITLWSLLDESNFVIQHNFTCTFFNILYCTSCSKCCKLRSVRNNDVDKPVARHFNTANYSISDIKVCAILPISGSLTKEKMLPFYIEKNIFVFILLYFNYCFEAWRNCSARNTAKVENVDERTICL